MKHTKQITFLAGIIYVVSSFLFIFPTTAKAIAPDEAGCWVCDNRCINGLNPDYVNKVAGQPMCECTAKQRAESTAVNQQCQGGKCCPAGTNTKPNPWYESGQCNDKKDKHPLTIAQECNQGILPFCARTKIGCTGIDDVLVFAIRYAKFIFGIAGSVALLFVIYGGMLMMFSFGNSETLQSGKKSLIAAVVGLIIIFSAYLIVILIVKNLGVFGATDFSLPF